MTSASGCLALSLFSALSANTRLHNSVTEKAIFSGPNTTIMSWCAMCAWHVLLRPHLVIRCHRRRVEVTLWERMWWRTSAFLWACDAYRHSHQTVLKELVLLLDRPKVLLTSDTKKIKITLQLELDFALMIYFIFHSQWKRKVANFKTLVVFQTHSWLPTTILTSQFFIGIHL